MALPTRPLAILDAEGTTRSIAREVDGNVTTPKQLLTLGDTAFGSGARPHAMSEFEGFSSGSELGINCYSTLGSQFTCCHCVFSCLTYDPALEASQTWCACICWKAYATAEGSFSRGYQTVRVACNGVTTMSCVVNRTTVGYTNCFGTTVVGPIDSNDNVCLITCSRGVYGAGSGGYGYASGQLYVYCSFGNTNGNVNLGALGTRCVTSIAQAAF